MYLICIYAKSLIYFSKAILKWDHPKKVLSLVYLAVILLRRNLCKWFFLCGWIEKVLSILNYCCWIGLFICQLFRNVTTILPPEPVSDFYPVQNSISHTSSPAVLLLHFPFVQFHFLCFLFPTVIDYIFTKKLVFNFCSNLSYFNCNDNARNITNG